MIDLSSLGTSKCNERQQSIVITGEGKDISNFAMIIGSKLQKELEVFDLILYLRRQVPPLSAKKTT